MSKERKNIDETFRNRPLAHRGLHDRSGAAPENSLAAFSRAADAGFGVELDVRLSRDGRVVVFHDAKLDRMTGRPGSVETRSLAELGEYRLLGGGEKIPLLSQAFEVLAGRVPVYVEIKSHGRPGRLEAAVKKELAGYRGPHLVGSFNPLSLAWFRRNSPGTVRAWISCGFGRDRITPERRHNLSHLTPWLGARPQVVSYGIFDLPARRVAMLRRAGVVVMAWTVRSPRGVCKARLLADNYVFEDFVPPTA